MPTRARKKKKATRGREWSPNQLAKRDLIVRAASRIMGKDGVRACTSRVISEASGLSTSALHYYFRDINEIFDLAFRRVVARFTEHVREAAAHEPNPIDALWAAASAYLFYGGEPTETSESKHGKLKRAPMLWYEYQAESLRSGNVATVAELADKGEEVFCDLIERTGVAHGHAKARALYAALAGEAARISTKPREPNQVLATLSEALAIPPSTKYC